MENLVSVVCLCYNHEKYVGRAIESVLNQTYKHVQLIIVDDCSTDGSVTIINQLLVRDPQITFLSLDANVGNCAAFNKGLAIAAGDFIVDFAADDVMVPERIERQVEQFRQLDSQYGVVFSNADYIDERGTVLRNHSEYLLSRKLILQIPEGWVFQNVLRRYFICTPTMMIRKRVLDELHGYDESLSYEDFDFWVRSSRDYKYAYFNKVLTHVRVSDGSMSTRLYTAGDTQLHSTFLVCRKAFKLCRHEEDKRALLGRVRYEFRHAIFSGNRVEANLFGQLESEIEGHGWQYYLFTFLSRLPIPWSLIRKKYQQIIYG